MNLKRQPGTQSVAEIVIECEIYSAVYMDVYLSLDTSILDTEAELFVGAVNYGKPSVVDATTVVWTCIDLNPGLLSPATFEVSISNLHIDASEPSPKHDSVYADVTFSGGPPVTNDALVVANLVDPCSYTVLPSAEEIGPEGGSGVLTVTAEKDCEWKAVSPQAWITIVSGGHGAGSGQIAYEVAANTGSVARTGTITVGDVNVHIHQGPAVDKPDLTITSFRVDPNGVTSTSLPNASASIENRVGGPAGPFRVAYYFSRDEVVTTADRVSATACPFEALDMFQPSACEVDIAIPSGLAPGTYYLGAIIDDNRKVEESDEMNNVRLNELGPIVIGEASEPAPPVAVTSSAAAESGIAPGLLVSIFGGDWSDEMFSAEGLPYPTELGGFSVEVDGEPIPLLFVGKQQINAMLPFNLEPGSTIEIRVVRDGKASDPLSLVVEPLSPGILTTSMDGTGQAAALGPDNEIADAAHPVSPGQPLQIFAVGLGAVDPPIAAGEPADPNVTLHHTVAEVRVFIGGLPAEVAFAGLAPNFSGLYQVNATVPSGLTPGLAVPVVLELVLEGGETLTSNEATIAVAP